MAPVVVSLTVPEWVDNPDPDVEPDPFPDPEGDDRFWQLDAPAGHHVVNTYVRRPIHGEQAQPMQTRVDHYVVDGDGLITGVVFLAEEAVPGLGVSRDYVAHAVCIPV